MKDKSVSWIFSLENDLHPSQVNVNGIDNSYFHRTIANLRKNCKVFRPEFIRIYCRSKQQSKMELANKACTYCIVASEKNVTDEQLGNIGKLTKLSLEEIFGY
ncbi:hypothetical protein H8B06_06210 [Sphingobacterium sp. DN00404]|uniref:Uncharacterized protein n=1 Tax=Sphingobacterium micropteri TaxID=2763501 RepID=A0ABR7YMF6_9SPHI|nr:hypothetical protein [Sphingobacterium micropteri]MBD1432411.1 hypothetical protein [Sphingobacterium micropteri]